ncbi:uncharacterized protein B0J16DRAFT_370191 [Fusarium flagelliforme]|uniref:uncharacterized protein n=1 Tax=Fusarium flagelliforme TaxID=2675880 RepID=UPI001E8E24AA|nr:uncharacterized protein B0J16DRAFT_370191 [Fusarium flagelliforme]KAH7188211.1 hypothetical protein B0J16DRAFT_370191 [Fusarium flagelliforme]
MALQSTSKMSINSILNPESPSNQPKLANTYWPVLRDSLLQDPSLYNNLHLDCGICLDKMAIFPHEHTFQNDHALKTISHGARILPCGHIFGTRCITSHFYNLMDNGQPVVCPACRTNLLRHKGCEDVNYGMAMPTSISEIRMFPDTIAEGGRLPDQCRDCQVADALSGIQFLASILVPPIDDGVVYVSAETATGYWWDTKPEEYIGEEFEEDIAIRGPLLKICQVVEMTMKANAVRSWCSGNFTGLEIAVGVCREPRIEV